MDLTEPELVALRLAADGAPLGPLGTYPILVGAFAKLGLPTAPALPPAVVLVIARVALEMESLPRLVADFAMGRQHWAGCAPTPEGLCVRCRLEAAEAALAMLTRGVRPS